MTDADDSDIRLRLLADTMAPAPGRAPDSKVRRLHDALLDMIERGSWRPSERLPGEKELADYLSVSLGTVQAAMRKLAHAGLVERRRGAGTFISGSDDVTRTVWHFRFLARDGRSLLPFEIQMLSVDETAAKGEWSEFLGPHPSFIRVRRIVTLGGAFKVHSEVYLEAAKFRPLLDVPLEVLSMRNLRLLLHDRFNAPTFRAVHRLRMVEIEAEVARLIDCAPGVLGLSMHAMVFTYRDAPILFQRNIVPPNDYRLEIQG